MGTGNGESVWLTGHQLFWDWTSLKYKETLCELYGIAYESHGKLDKNQLKTMNMDEDQVIRRLGK